jgi:hypothetical protein
MSLNQTVRIRTSETSAEPFVPDPSISKVEFASGKFKRSQAADQIPAVMIQAEGEHCILRSTNLLC